MFAFPMTQRQSIISLAVFMIMATAFITGPGCANIIPPAGGPRDSLAPVLEKSSPPDSTRNFSGNRISFTFNEFVDLIGPQENMVISPLPKNYPTVDFRLNTVTVKLKDTLESNTTYTINFGDAIRDFNEGNILKNFTYTFSTGSYIDSLELSGNVLLAETGKFDTTLIVMLHTNADDSAVVKGRPRYYTKLDRQGNFYFRNLPPKTFYIYALKDEGGTRRYFNDRQLFAFADKPVTVGSKNEAITLNAYAAKPVSAAALLVNPNRNRPANIADKRLKYSTSNLNTPQDLQSPFSITFDLPLKIFDTAGIHLFIDTTYSPPGAYSFTLDSSRKKVTLSHDWKENMDYRIILDKGFAEDSSGKKLLKTDTLVFRTKKLADYGSLKLKLRNLDLSRNPVLLIYSNDLLYKSYPLTGDEISQSLFLPGEYELRILYDDNKNGKWDPGEFFGKHKQPEIVKPIERKISVKAAFVNEFELAL